MPPKDAEASSTQFATPTSTQISIETATVTKSVTVNADSAVRTVELETTDTKTVSAEPPKHFPPADPVVQVNTPMVVKPSEGVVGNGNMVAGLGKNMFSWPNGKPKTPAAKANAAMAKATKYQHIYGKYAKSAKAAALKKAAAAAQKKSMRKPTLFSVRRWIRHWRAGSACRLSRQASIRTS